MLEIKSIRIMFKILIMILAVCMFESLLLTSMSGIITESTLESIISENSSKNAELYSEFIGNWFAERMNEIEFYANTPLVKSMDWNSMEAYLIQEVSKKLDIFDHFMVADSSGNYSNTLQRNVGCAADREYFTAAMEGKVVVSDPLISRTNGKPVTVVAAPIRDADGKVIGVMSGTINLIKLSRIIDNFNYNHPDSYSYIIDKNGLIIAHPNESYILKENITVESESFSREMVEASAEILANYKGSNMFTFKNVNSMNYYHTIPNTNGWKLIISIPVDYWRNPIKYASTQLMLTGLAGLIAVSIPGFFIAKSISNPIIKLRESFISAASGDLTVRSEIHSDDEIGDAAKSFNKMMETIRSLTYYDTLTQLPNRMLFKANLDAELANSRSKDSGLAVMIFDIDKFESINNTLGYTAGDKLLKAVAQKINTLTEYGYFVSHLGEDRFAILFKNFQDRGDVLKLVDNIRDIISRPWIIDAHRFYITACIGVAFYPEDGESSDSLLKNAFSAMHKAKVRGRNNYELYDPSVNARLLAQLNMDSSMHYALDNGEFSLYYQPQVDAVTREIIGCEALIRWNHPELGMISPLEFIPVSEANGMIILIGRWVLYTACMQNKLWQDAGHKPIFVSVNLSAVQLIQEDFIDMVSDILEETGLSPEYLALEITESAAVKNYEHITSILEKLKSMGIKIALDDFGTGYSSLNYLKNFAITTLKIDRSFITDIAENSKNLAIVSSIIAMGRNLKLDVTAEGVETCEQYEILKRGGCNIIQGYYFSEPLPLNEFEKLWLS